jgi:hypothetical protein
MEMSVIQPDWIINAKTELDRAIAARIQKNEGKARVCARRAAGHIIKAYLSKRDYDINRLSLYDSIQYFVNLETGPIWVRELASHFLLRITPEHNLPIDADLLEDVRRLAKELMGVEM